MSDLISREFIIKRINAYKNLSEYYHNEKCSDIPMQTVLNFLEQAPSLEGVVGIIRCQDCKWWDRLEKDHSYGYCQAFRSGTHTERWEISIRRQCRYDFWCAGAESKENEDDDE